MLARSCMADQAPVGPQARETGERPSDARATEVARRVANQNGAERELRKKSG